MNNLYKRFRQPALVVPILIGLSSLAMGAAIGLTWKKSEIIPVILVKPGIGGFVPVQGNSIGNTWRMSDVKPVLLVKPGVGGFVPREGTRIGNTWEISDVLPVMLVEPSPGGFIPLRIITSEDKPIEDAPLTVPAPNSIIESKIEGDFEGWEGETIVKLMNGQIWQQNEFHFHYHYAFMPKVLIFWSDGAYKMQVEGIEKSVGVKRLK